MASPQSIGQDTQFSKSSASHLEFPHCATITVKKNENNNNYYKDYYQHKMH